MAATAPDGSLRETWRTMATIFLSQRNRFLDVVGTYGLTPVHAAALRELAVAGPVPMRMLAGTLRCDASNVTGIVDRLEERALVERRPDPTDRRVKLVSLTDAGRRTVQALEQVMFEPPAALEALDETERATLRRLLGKVQAQLDASSDDSSSDDSPATAPPGR